MAIRAVCGRPGSGKSLYLVSRVMRPASLADRMIVVYGMDGLEIPHDRMSQDDLLPAKGGHYIPSLDFLRGIPPGSILVIDEAHKVFGAGSGVSLGADLRDWFARHRHYTDARGRPMEIWVAVQDPMQLTAQFKALVDEWYHFKRGSVIGFKGLSILNVWDGPPGEKGSSRTGHKIVWDDKSSYRFYKSTVGETSAETDLSRYGGGKVRFWAAMAVIGSVMTGIWMVLAGGWFKTPGASTAARVDDRPVQSLSEPIYRDTGYRWDPKSITITISPGERPDYGRYPWVR